ncbi:MAG TPA: PstS family phosphate ABC transporter substrate-binding protein [Pirellulales bacterium]|nr:PstS family phosphate ABC transporter substrate-binding protein [Pirellulales bacterium]
MLPKCHSALLLSALACWAPVLALVVVIRPAAVRADDSSPQRKAVDQAATKAPSAAAEPALADYKVTSGVSGSIKSVGSDTMNNLMTLWTEGFKRHYPDVRAEVEGKGSSTAPPALIAGTATFGPMSRDMKASEIDAFDAKYGYKPVLLPAAIDMLAVYVHRDNPIQQLSLGQLDAIYSQHRKSGFRRSVRTWGDLGLTDAWKNRTISAYGRNAASGTYAYFKENALFGGDYRESVIELPGSSSVVQSVAGDLYAIGYSGIGFATAGVRAVPLAIDTSSKAVPPEPQFALTGDYPLARFLWIAVNYKPGSTLDPLRGEFIKYVFSAAGQSDVVRDGYYPVSASVAARALASVGIRMPDSGADR